MLSCGHTHVFTVLGIESRKTLKLATYCPQDLRGGKLRCLDSHTDKSGVCRFSSKKEAPNSSMMHLVQSAQDQVREQIDFGLETDSGVARRTVTQIKGLFSHICKLNNADSIPGEQVLGHYYKGVNDILSVFAVYNSTRKKKFPSLNKDYWSKNVIDCDPGS